MKYLKIAFISILIFMATLLLSLERGDKLPIKIGEPIKEYGIGDIVGDGRDYLVVLTGGRGKEYGEKVLVFDLENKEEIYRRDFSPLKPWKLIVGDIDGDKIDEISIGVYKEAPLHPIMAKRPFIYSFREGQIVPKWRGSRLSRPFTDYIFYDIDGDGIDEIVAIEILRDNRKVINTYKWKGFGFEGFLESEDLDDINELTIRDGRIHVGIEEGKESFMGLLKLEDGNLIIERVE